MKTLSTHLDNYIGNIKCQKKKKKKQNHIVGLEERNDFILFITFGKNMFLKTSPPHRQAT